MRPNGRYQYGTMSHLPGEMTHWPLQDKPVLTAEGSWVLAKLYSRGTQEAVAFCGCLLTTHRGVKNTTITLKKRKENNKQIPAAILKQARRSQLADVCDRSHLASFRLPLLILGLQISHKFMPPFHFFMQKQNVSQFERQAWLSCIRTLDGLSHSPLQW